jgi:cation transport ATPase
VRISSQIKIIKTTGIFGSLGLAFLGIVALVTLSKTAAFIGDFAILLFFQAALYFLFSAGVLALTNLGCILLERAFKNELETELPGNLES